MQGGVAAVEMMSDIGEEEVRGLLARRAHVGRRRRQSGMLPARRLDTCSMSPATTARMKSSHADVIAPSRFHFYRCSWSLSAGGSAYTRPPERRDGSTANLERAASFLARRLPFSSM